MLNVNEFNAPALALYARHGYHPSGATIDHRNLPGVRELELVKHLP